MKRETDPELLEFLKRHEVRTLAKDLARLREEQARKERERIESIKVKEVEEIKVVAGKETPLGFKEKTKEALAQVGLERMKTSFPVKPERFNKIFIRILFVAIVLLVALNVVGLIYWLAEKRKQEPVSKVTPQENPKEPQLPPPQIPKTPEPEPSPIFFQILASENITFQNKEEIFSVLNLLLKKEISPGFLQINLFRTPDNVALNSEEFFDALSIKAPTALLAQLTDNMMMFLYTDQTKTRKRMGFVIQLKESEGVKEILFEWEKEMEASFLPLLSLMGPKDRAYVKFFKSIEYKKIPIRFQTFSIKDLGICYAVVDKYLVFTASLESMEKVIDQLKTQTF